MRIVAGRHRGRRLRAPAGQATRPTADRVREALFSMLGSVHGQRVLDLFAGTGALGLEAVSRGAAAAVFVERSAPALAALGANVQALGLNPEQAEIRAQTVRAALRRARERGETYDLVLVDPPYGQASALGGELSDALPALLGPGARVVTESDRHAPIELALPVVLTRRYGDTVIAIHHPPGDPAPR
ncbi:MAG: 16S rRNA (guanine(966)-N(2))-methyltransferase RsmD [Actinobacteria bacterium]|nr:MAG: 16S rRNA (guanine(966)-N(2))-methyltransferase RsmD [Actinomycetota bacterium]